ncbi:Rab family GTPase [Entamoeba marina]
MAQPGSLYDGDVGSTDFKIVFTGSPFVGKTTILYYMIENQFREELPQEIPDSHVFELKEDEQVFLFHLNDTSGQEVYRTITSSYYRCCHGVFLVYAVDDQQSFDDLKGYCSDITTYTNGKEPKIFLLANKTDQERVVTTEKGQKFAKDNKLSYREVCAKTGDGIANVFKEMQDALRKNEHSNKKKKKKTCVLF